MNDQQALERLAEIDKIAANAKARVSVMMGAQTLAGLVALFEATENIHGVPEISDVRGFIMDELERRNPRAFGDWIDAEPVVASPRQFFI